MRGITGFIFALTVIITGCQEIIVEPEPVFNPPNDRYSSAMNLRGEYISYSTPRKIDILPATNTDIDFDAIIERGEFIYRKIKIRGLDGMMEDWWYTKDYPDGVLHSHGNLEDRRFRTLPYFYYITSGETMDSVWVERTSAKNYNYCFKFETSVCADTTSMFFQCEYLSEAVAEKCWGLKTIISYPDERCEGLPENVAPDLFYLSEPLELYELRSDEMIADTMFHADLIRSYQADITEVLDENEDITPTDMVLMKSIGSNMLELKGFMDVAGYTKRTDWPYPEFRPLKNKKPRHYISWYFVVSRITAEGVWLTRSDKDFNEDLGQYFIPFK